MELYSVDFDEYLYIHRDYSSCSVCYSASVAEMKKTREVMPIYAGNGLASQTSNGGELPVEEIVVFRRNSPQLHVLDAGKYQNQ